MEARDRIARPHARPPLLVMQDAEPQQPVAEVPSEERCNVTRDFATDPEIAADLIRRARSERDPNRTREPANPFGAPAIVEHWPCRGGCGAMVGVTREAIEALEVHNRQLLAQRESPISKAKVMWCPRCKARDDELRRMQRETGEAARRPREQLGMQLGERTERPSGMATKQPQRRRKTL